MKLKYLASHIDERHVRDDTDLLSVSKIKGVVPRSEVSDNQGRAEDKSHYKTCKPGDLVINRMAAYQGALGIAKQFGAISPDYMVLRFKSAMNPSFVGYLFKSSFMANEMSSRVKGIGSIDSGSVRTPRLSWSDLGEVDVPVPPLEEQKAIADFLDEQLVKIDLLIEKEKNLIMLSSERRIAAISDLVTRGFRQLGTSHWNACRLKHVATIFSSNVDKKTYDDGVPVQLCNYVDVYYNDRISEDLDFMEATASPGEIRKFQLRAGWVVATKDSESADDIGIAAYVDKDLPGVVCGYHLAILQPSECLNGLFLKYFLDSSEAKTQLAKKATGLTRVGLGKGDFGSLVINVPPLNEQELIAAKITDTCDRLDTLIAASKDLISKLEERRKALVSAAVIGKIDVRGKN